MGVNLVVTLLTADTFHDKTYFQPLLAAGKIGNSTSHKAGRRSIEHVKWITLHKQQKPTVRPSDKRKVESQKHCKF